MSRRDKGVRGRGRTSSTVAVMERHDRGSRSRSTEAGHVLRPPGGEGDGLHGSLSQGRGSFRATAGGERREISRRGGEAPHPRRENQEWSEEEARECGRSGGREANDRGTAYEWSGREAHEAGREGGRSRRESADEGEYCPECGRGGRSSCEEESLCGAEIRWGSRDDEEEDGSERGRTSLKEAGRRGAETRGDLRRDDTGGGGGVRRLGGRAARTRPRTRAQADD